MVFNKLLKYRDKQQLTHMSAHVEHEVHNMSSHDMSCYEMSSHDIPTTLTQCVESLVT